MVFIGWLKIGCTAETAKISPEVTKTCKICYKQYLQMKEEYLASIWNIKQIKIKFGGSKLVWQTVSWIHNKLFHCC